MAQELLEEQEKDKVYLERMNKSLVVGEPSYHDITRVVSEIVEVRTPKAWYIAIGITGGITRGSR